MSRKFKKFMATVVFCTMFFSIASSIPVMASITSTIIKSGLGTLAGIAVDNNGNIIVVDETNNKVLKLSPEGSTINEWGSENFTSTQSVAIDSSNNIYVADDGAHNIKKIDNNNNTVTVIPTTLNGSNSGPTGIAVDSQNRIYYSSWNSVYRMNYNGSNFTQLASSYGFYANCGFAVDAEYNVYVADSNNNKVEKINTDGITVTILGQNTTFAYPSSVAFDSDKNVYVADSNNVAIKKIDTDGNATTLVSTYSSGVPVGVALDSDNNVYYCTNAGYVMKVVDTSKPTPAKGLTATVAAKTPAKENRVNLTVTPAVADTNHELCYRVVNNPPSALNVGVVLTGVWNSVTDTNSHEISAEDGQYVEVVEVTKSDNKVTRWGKSEVTDDGFISNYEITLSPEGTYTFPSKTTGYSSVPAKSITIFNTGTENLTNLQVAISGVNSDSFTLITPDAPSYDGLDTTSLLNLEVTSSAAVTIKPNDSLAVGTYTATVTVYNQVFDTTVLDTAEENLTTAVEGNGVVSKSVNVSFTVTASSSSSSSSSGNSSSNTKTITVPVTDGNSDNLLSQTVIQRITQTDGTKKDVVSYTADKASQTVASLIKEGKDTARIMLPDNRDEVSEARVNIPKATISVLESGKINLEIDTENARLSLPKESIQGLSQNGDFYFRFVPIKDETKKKEIEAMANQQQAIRNISGKNSAQALGRPMTIDTNMSQRPVDIIIPLKGFTIPSNPAEREAFLKDLGVFIEHSDGEKVLARGEIVEYSSGVLGLKVRTTKFSDFTIVKLNQQTTSNSVGSWEKSAQGWKYIKDGQPVSGWNQIDGSWYLMDSTSVMQTGWKETNGTWYFLKDSGDMATGWVQTNNQWYYLYSGGTMASNTIIDGYSLDENGVWLQ